MHITDYVGIIYIMQRLQLLSLLDVFSVKYYKPPVGYI